MIGHAKFSLIDLGKLYHPTKWVVSGSDWPFLIDSFAERKSLYPF